MDLIVSTSRGGKITSYLNQPRMPVPIKTISAPGASFAKLQGIAIREINKIKSKSQNSKIHVYIMGGINDITKLEKGTGYCEAVVRDGSADETTSRIMAQVKILEELIKKKGQSPASAP